MKYYVNCSSAAGGDGSEAKPFNKIQQAADIAVAGDEVIVAPGLYREYVDPKNAGEEEKPVVYRSSTPRGAHITGAEELKGWTKVEGSVYTARISNKIFGDYNPYTTLVSGDWFIAYFIAHTGDVYLNGKSLYEVQSLEEVKKDSYAEVMERFRELKADGRVAFTTFHQSYGYEEFIEGIKPKLNSEDGSLGYTIEDGVFKGFYKNRRGIGEFGGEGKNACA